MDGPQSGERFGSRWLTLPMALSLAAFALVVVVIPRAVEVHDFTRGHMGSSPMMAWYLFLSFGALMSIPVALGIGVAAQHRAIAITLAAAGAIAAVVTLAYQLTGLSRCRWQRFVFEPPGALDRYLIVLVSLVTLVAFASGLWLGYRSQARRAVLGLALVTVPVGSFLMVLQGESCQGVSGQVTRGLAGLALAIFGLPIAFLLTTIGRAIGSRLYRSRSPSARQAGAMSASVRRHR